MWFFRSVLLALLFYVPAAWIVPPSVPASLPDHPGRSSVVMMSTSTGQGSGFLLGGGIVGTAAHVVRGGTVFVWMPEGRRQAVVLCVAPGRDVAQVWVGSNQGDPVRTSERALDKGESVTVAGYPNGEWSEIPAQYVGSVSFLPADDKIIVGPLMLFAHRAGDVAGVSGGVVADASGAVVGIVVSQSERNPVRNVAAVPVRTMRETCGR